MYYAYIKMGKDIEAQAILNTIFPNMDDYEDIVELKIDLKKAATKLVK